MATQPDPNPDTINPGSPDEMPPASPPNEAPMEEPPGFEPPQPDIDTLDRGPLETPPPPD